MALCCSFSLAANDRRNYSRFHNLKQTVNLHKACCTCHYRSVLVFPVAISQTRYHLPAEFRLSNTRSYPVRRVDSKTIPSSKLCLGHSMLPKNAAPGRTIVTIASCSMTKTLSRIDTYLHYRCFYFTKQFRIK